jgi:NADH-quinone oxidoreductase subunit J
MVLFVFVIMLLNAGEEERSRGSHIALLLGVPGVIVLGCLVAWTMLSHNTQLGAVRINTADFGATQPIARLLFRDFLLPFEITSVLILIAIMGAVVLGRRES